MGDVSPHFSRREFDSHDGHRANPDAMLLAKLERLREICGNRPLQIVSGYRSVAHNKAVGGAKRSQHLYNRAADIPPGYATPQQAIAAGFTGIGIATVLKGGRFSQWATHVDVRPGRLTTWHY